MKQNVGVLDEQFRVNLAEWLKTATFVLVTSMIDDDSHDSMISNGSQLVLNRFTFSYSYKENNCAWFPILNRSSNNMSSWTVFGR